MKAIVVSHAICWHFVHCYHQKLVAINPRVADIDIEEVLAAVLYTCLEGGRLRPLIGLFPLVS